MNLRFHWMLPKSGEVGLQRTQTPRDTARFRLESTRVNSAAAKPDMDGWKRFAEHAEKAGIESVLVALNDHEPDPLMIACALGLATNQLKFIAAYHSGLMQPATFVQQVNTLSSLINGRIDVNIVAGNATAEQQSSGGFLTDDERYVRAEEFLAVCNGFWRSNGEVNFDGKYYHVEKGKLNTPFIAADRAAPEIYVSGHTERAQQLACSQGTCWSRVIDTPEKLEPTVSRMRGHGLHVCLQLSLICRRTREEAVSVAESILPEDYRDGAITPTEQNWLNRNLWTGLVPHYGSASTVLLGTPEELADAFLEYRRIGVTEFIISGWPEIDEVDRFGLEVLPLVRDAELSLLSQRFLLT